MKLLRLHFLFLHRDGCRVKSNRAKFRPLPQQPIFRTPYKLHIQPKGTVNFIARVFAACRFKWFVWPVSFFLVGRLVGLSMFTIWAVDCFFREFRTAPTCTHFFLIPVAWDV